MSSETTDESAAGAESAESAESTQTAESTGDLTDTQEADDPIVSGSSEAEFEEAMAKAQEAQDAAREEMETIDPGDQSQMPAGEVEVEKPDVGKPGDPGTFLTEIDPAGDATGDADPGQPGGDIPEDPAEATNAQNEQLRRERLDADNRPDGAEVNNSHRDYDPETGRFASSPELDEEPGPYT